MGRVENIREALIPERQRDFEVPTDPNATSIGFLGGKLARAHIDHDIDPENESDTLGAESYKRGAKYAVSLAVDALEVMNPDADLGEFARELIAAHHRVEDRLDTMQRVSGEPRGVIGFGDA